MTVRRNIGVAAESLCDDRTTHTRQAVATKGRKVPPTLSPHIRELAHRRSANLEVTLLWNRRSHRVWISIYNVANDEQAAAPVPHEQALDAFEHPYAYVAA